MLTKRTSKNQITIPKSIIKNLPDTDYFDVSIKDRKIILQPVIILSQNEKLEKIRKKIKRLGITEKDIEDAILWARKRKT